MEELPTLKEKTRCFNKSKETEKENEVLLSLSSPPFILFKSCGKSPDDFKTKTLFMINRIPG